MDEADIRPGMAVAPRNQWYVVAFSREITRKPMTRQVNGEPVVLFRTEAGEPVALFDRCPHRGMPLSKGKLLGDRLQCAYHGLEYATDGRCQLVPNSDTIPLGLRVRAYPLAEVWQWVWIWMGDPDKADRRLIPDSTELGLTTPGFNAEPGVLLTVDANFLMVMENFADTTHLPHLHGFNPFQPPELITVEGACVRTTRIHPDEKVEPFMKTFGVNADRIDRTLTHWFYPPHLVVARTLFADVKGIEPTMDNRWIKAYTPAGPRRTHVFVSLAQNYVNPMRWEEFPEIMRSDFEALEAIQRLMDSLPAKQTPQVDTPGDLSVLKARELLARMLAAEAATP